MEDRPGHWRSVTIPPCLTDADTHCMSKHLYYNVIVNIDQNQNNGCPRPCVEVHYKIDVRYGFAISRKKIRLRFRRE